jgi:hypothetical protein
LTREDTPLHYQEQSLLIDTKVKYGKRVPIDLCGDLFRHLSPMMGHSVRMAVEGTSTTIGAPPMWLRRASDVRVLGFSEKHGKTLLKLAAPHLGEAARELYAQNTLWETRPSEEDTAVNVFARVMLEIRKGDLWMLRPGNWFFPFDSRHWFGQNCALALDKTLKDDALRF